MNLRWSLSLLCFPLLAAQLYAADGTAAGANATSSANATVKVSSAPGPGISMKEVEEIRAKIAAQEKEIEQLQKSLAEQRAILDTTVKVVAAANAAGSGTTAMAPRLMTVGGSSEAALQPVEAAAAVPRGEAMKSPISIPIGDAQLTPFGFVDFTAIVRSTNVGSGIGTGFGGIPYGNTAAGQLSEMNFSAQNSRIGARFDSTVHGAAVLGYVEADFLGQQGPNVFVTSNADTFRLRNYFVDIRKNQWEIMGGQDWSLMTPNRTGLSPVPGDIFFSQNMDTNYQVGLIWSRQAQFRIGYHPSKNFAIALSLENPQQYIGNVGVVFPSALNSLSGQFNNGTTNYSVPNLHPDIVVKAAYDGHVAGLTEHIEAAGLLRTFKYFNPASGINQSFSATGGGGSVNGNFEVLKGVHVVTNNFLSDGGGRYIFGLGPDLILRPNGGISLVHAYSTVDGLEANLTRNLLLYSYYGGAYYGKNTAIDTNGKLVGYGYSGSSASSNRTIQEFTVGLTPTFWKSTQYGALQLITQYSYVWRNPWSVALGSPSKAATNMVYIDLRYVLP